MNLADELGRQAGLRPDAVAVCLPAKSLSFRHLDRLTWQIANFLCQQGVKPGDVVVLSFTSELALLATLFATARIGATTFSLPRNSPPRLLKEMVARTHAHSLASDFATTDSAGLNCLRIDIAALAANNSPIDKAIHVTAPQAPWLLIAGSGSTGHPKLFAVSHAQFYSRTKLAGAQLALSPNDRLATLSPLDFTSPKERYLTALFAGASVVLFDRGRADPLALCRDRRITVLDATVFHIERLLGTLPGTAKNQLGMLRVLLLSASTVSDGLRQRIAASLGPALHVRYGTNETGPLTIVRPDEVMGTPGTVGRPPAGVRIEVVDSSHRELPIGAVGMIRVKSPGMINHYQDDEQASRHAFREDWFMPGDLGKITQDGQLIFCGRNDHMMIMNGINIYPAEIERVVSLHPAVRDAVAVPLRSDLHQDMPVCAVTLQPSARITQRELLDFARQHLSSHCPQRIIVLERIPRNEQGKLQRQQLARAIAAQIRPQTQRVRIIQSLVVNNWKVRPQQPMRNMQIRFHCANPPDLAAIDKEFAALEIASEPCNSPYPPPWNPMFEPFAELAWRILLLSKALLQAANFPVFDSGCVLRIEQDGNNSASWVTTVAVVYIDNLPLRCLTVAQNEAVRLVLWLAQKPLTAESMTKLFDTIHKQVLPPLRRQVASGKSTLHVLRAAHARNIPFSHLGGGVYQLGWGSKGRLTDRSTTAMDSAIGSKLAQNKVWSATLLRMAGLPAPQHVVVATQEDAMRAAHRLGWLVVVKPVDRERGEGVTVGVRDDQQLLAAFKLAKGMSRVRQALVEREVKGVCHRLFIADGHLLYAVKRLPKSIHGDGRQTIAALIGEANRCNDLRPPWLRSERYPEDALAGAAMAAAGFSFDSIPAAGIRVPLRMVESSAWGGFDEDVTASIHPANLDIALRATALFNLQVAGIDIITPAIDKPWHENGAIINEVNFAPLLGGGEISRNHVPEFISRLIYGDGRIPIEAVVGGAAALEVALTRQKELAREKVDCYITSHDMTLTATGNEMQFPFISLSRRCQALLMDRRVDALVLVVQTDELLRSGLPLDRIKCCTASGDALKQAQSPDARENLLAWLRSCTSLP